MPSYEGASVRSCAVDGHLIHRRRCCIVACIEARAEKQSRSRMQGAHPSKTDVRRANSRHGRPRHRLHNVGPPANTYTHPFPLDSISPSSQLTRLVPLPTISPPLPASHSTSLRNVLRVRARPRLLQPHNVGRRRELVPGGLWAGLGGWGRGRVGGSAWAPTRGRARWPRPPTPPVPTLRPVCRNGLG